MRGLICIARIALLPWVGGVTLAYGRPATLRRPGGEARRAAGPLAIVHVTLIPMDRERTRRDQTIIIDAGRIVAVGAADSVRIPAGAARVDGRGMFVIPGLHDMHAHLLSDGWLPDSLAGDELAIMIANGVTSARLMIGTPEQLALRRRIAAGELLGPRLTIGSPQFAGRSFADHFNGYLADSPDSARAAVRRAKAAGYDFIKVTFFISRPVYEAIVEEAHAQGMRVVGHVDPQVGLARALAAGEQIEHLDGYLEAALADDAPVRRSISGVQVWQRANWESLDWLDDRKLDSLAGATARAGVWSTATLTFFRRAFGEGETDEQMRVRADWRYIPRQALDEWTQPREMFWRDPPPAHRRARLMQVRDHLVRAMHDSGAKLMVGSDAPDWFFLYGFAVHDELANLVRAGLTPFSALQAATTTPAQWVTGDSLAGRIAVGLPADLVLLGANPLDDIANTRRIVGVALRGQWLARRELDQLLDRAATDFRSLQ